MFAMERRVPISKVVVLGLIAILTAPATGAYHPGTPPFSAAVNGEPRAFDVSAVFVMPGDVLEIRAGDAGSRASFRLVAPAGDVDADASGAWSWTAPARPGVVPLRVERGASGEAVVLNAMVLRPATDIEDGRLAGYRIGSYPARPLRNLPAYLPPPGFAVLTAETAATRVSPNFTLGQFQCKQAGDYPKAVVLHERLLRQLEFLLAAVRDEGHDVSSFHVMSGYRTPFYNEAIGNVKYSRHQYGDAADVFVDENPRDGVMDDLNRDGKVDKADAIWLRDLFDRALAGDGAEGLQGGLGAYGSNAAHGPFVHVDTRGFPARW